MKLEIKKCNHCNIIKPIVFFNKKKQSSDKHRHECKKCEHDLKSKYYIKNKEIIKSKVKQWKIDNPEKYIASQKNQRIKRKNKIRTNSRIYHKNRKKNDPLFKMRSLMSNRLYCAFRRRKSNKNTTLKSVLGISMDLFKLHMEKQFKKGMNWNNHGSGIDKWNIDHKIPVSSAKNEEELLVLFHYTNLQPLWWIDNMKKSNKILPIQTKLII